MTQDQVLSVARAVLQISGTYLTSWGLLTTTDWTTFTGAILMIVPVAWGLYVHSQAGIVASVDRLAKDPESPVKAVVLAPTPEGEALKQNLPGPTTVVAGTAIAETVAQG